MQAAVRLGMLSLNLLARLDSMDTGKTLILIGAVLVAAGFLWLAASRLGLGRLPGDIVIERENFRLYLPLGSCLLISVLISVLFWIIGRD